jgi:two-component system NarL family sensor kinase
MSIQSKAATAYAAAVVIPLLSAALWDGIPSLLQFAPVIVALLLVALFARFGGFGSAIVFILTSSAALWAMLFRFEPAALAVRVVIYIAAATIIASISRQRSQEAMEAEERYRNLVELAPDGFVVTDEKGKIVFANSALARTLGANDPASLIGRKAVDFVHPDERDEALRRIEQLSAGQATPWITARAIRVDGKIIEVERAGIPLRHGDKLFGQGFIRDITERNKTAAKIEEDQRRLQALFETAMDAIIMIDASGRYIDANPAATVLTGYTREEILQMKVGDLAPPEKRGEVMEIWNSLAADRTITGGEFQILRKDGGTRDVEFRMVVNMLTGLHCAHMHDVTDRKEAERSLRQLSGRLLRLQDEERRRIARELHDTTAQNLAATRVNLSRISKSSAVSDVAIRETVEESIRLTDQSISEVRTLSYLLHPPLIDEAGLIPSLRWLTRGFQERSGIEVTFDAADPLERMPREVETALFRIVQEALTNIQRHSGSTVARIRLEKEQNEIRLEIEDDGRGLPEDLREKTALTAAGVGVAAIQQRVRELGGQLQIQSRERGTSIVVTMPILEK